MKGRDSTGYSMKVPSSFNNLVNHHSLLDNALINRQFLLDNSHPPLIFHQSSGSKVEREHSTGEREGASQREREASDREKETDSKTQRF